MGISPKEYVIKIEVENGKIKLGRNHAVAAFEDDVVKWTCEGYPFAVQFPPGSPFEVENTGHISTLKEKDPVIPSLPYKYTIAVFDEKSQKVLILDPVYIKVPPRG